MTWLDGLTEKDRVRSGDEIKGARSYKDNINEDLLIFLCQLRPKVQQHTSIALSLDDKRKKKPCFLYPEGLPCDPAGLPPDDLLLHYLCTCIFIIRSICH